MDTRRQDREFDRRRLDGDSNTRFVLLLLLFFSSSSCSSFFLLLACLLRSLQKIYHSHAHLNEQMLDLLLEMILTHRMDKHKHKQCCINVSNAFVCLNPCHILFAFISFYAIICYPLSTFRFNFYTIIAKYSRFYCFFFSFCLHSSYSVHTSSVCCAIRLSFSLTAEWWMVLACPSEAFQQNCCSFLKYMSSKLIGSLTFLVFHFNENVWAFYTM